AIGGDGVAGSAADVDALRLDHEAVQVGVEGVVERPREHALFAAGDLVGGEGDAGDGERVNADGDLALYGFAAFVAGRERVGGGCGGGDGPGAGVVDEGAVDGDGLGVGDFPREREGVALPDVGLVAG